MSPVVFILVLLSASLHVTWNALVKTSYDKIAFAWVTTVAGVVVLIPFAVVSLLLTSSPVTVLVFELALCSGLFEALYVIFLFKAYERSDLSVVYPLSRGIAPVMTMLVAGSFVGDSVTLKGVIGICVIIAGVVFVSLSSIDWEHQDRRIDLTGIFLAFCTGCMIAGYHLVDRRAMTAKLPPAPLEYLFLVQFFMAVFVTVWAAFSLKKGFGSVRKECKSNLKGVVIVGIATPLAYLLIILALSLGNVTYIVAGRNIGIFLSTVVGAIFLGERVKGVRLAGGVLIALGVIFLVLTNPGG